MDWIALKHALLSHLPVAAGLLLPWPLFAAQRPGRGIRPWWTVTRYLGWMGLLGSLASLVSGLASGRLLGLLPAHRLLPAPATGQGPEALLFRHAALGGLSLLVGLAAIWAMNRSRKDHQSLGFVALVLGLGWSALLLMAGDAGYRLAHARAAKPVVVEAPPLVPKAVLPQTVTSTGISATADAEEKAPVRALDYAALEAIHSEPVKSPAHGGRWIRVWASPEAAAAYRAGQPLPEGALVVLSSMEDRYGRPGSENGPLYALEMKPSGPTFTFYWARIPMEQRRAFGGEAKAYWRGTDTHLEGCRSCHATGMADPAARSRWRLKRITSAD
ncbi:hypothetical protein [Geothrix sp. PMB-07]|uniref:hypothetical protein n=1 Tax=Geothrix sp. PMB-07 TaxID=3068640 RepID=UPI002740C603|nr:hypothetical protein [Geothrix sp. PMB-07]WLT31991.1 hypothetical protein Q9293_01420 [Geothrix sp. PMB-07]